MKTPYADAFVAFQTKLTSVGETAKEFERNGALDDRDAHHRAVVDCLAAYNRILSQLQEAGIEPQI